MTYLGQRASSVDAGTFAVFAMLASKALAIPANVHIQLLSNSSK